MGSGLGGALIVKSPMIDEPLVLPTEVGHIQIPIVCDKDPASALEHDLVQHISDHYYGGAETPEYEDISSGRGLCLAFQFFKHRNEKEHIPIERLDAGEIAESARQGNRTAKEALLWHYKIFLRAAKAVGTSLICDSLVLALDNQVKNSWFVSAVANKLRDEFYNFIRPDWMKGIRVYAQKEILNFNILGTDYMAHQLARRSV
jgi:glucokinase